MDNPQSPTKPKTGIFKSLGRYLWPLPPPPPSPPQCNSARKPYGPASLEATLDELVEEDLCCGRESPSELTIWMGELMMEKYPRASRDGNLSGTIEVLDATGFSRSASLDLTCPC